MLFKLGVDALASAPDVLARVDRILQEKYRFVRPRKFPRLGVSIFREQRHTTIGGRQFVLEQGLLVGKFWRIRERGHPFLTSYYIWDVYHSEAAAVEHWEGFVALLRARHELTKSG